MDRKIHCSACLFYYARADEFRTWLRDAKDMYLDDIAAYEAQELFAQFVDRWNAGRLDASYYSDRPRWCPTCEVMEKTLCTEAEACAALDVFDEETLAIEWIRLRRVCRNCPAAPAMAAPAMSSGKLENGIRCSSHPLSTTGCVAQFGNISPAEMGRSKLWLNTATSATGTCRK